MDKKPKKFYKKNIGNGLEYLLKKCLPKHFNGNFDELSNAIRERYHTQLNTRTRIFDGIIPVLEKLKINQFKMAVISNKLHSLALKSVKKYFDSYKMEVIGALNGFLENQILFNLLHAQNFNCHPSDAFFVGDSIVDIKTAQSAANI